MCLLVYGAGAGLILAIALFAFLARGVYFLIEGT